jgi:hypothetical protein
MTHTHTHNNNKLMNYYGIRNTHGVRWMERGKQHYTNDERELETTNTIC